MEANEEAAMEEYRVVRRAELVRVDVRVLASAATIDLRRRVDVSEQHWRRRVQPHSIQCWR